MIIYIYAIVNIKGGYTYEISFTISFYEKRWIECRDDENNITECGGSVEINAYLFKFMESLLVYKYFRRKKKPHGCFIKLVFESKSFS